MPPRVFTADEANAALSEVRPLVEAMVEGKRALDEAQERRDDVAQRIAGNGGGIPPAELGALETAVEEAAKTLAETIGEIQAMGVLVKDLDSGLVDFPAKRDGEDILLCWRLGEDEVAFWHGPEDGYAGRRPL
jgi:hypothetical protein